MFRAQRKLYILKKYLQKNYQVKHLRLPDKPTQLQLNKLLHEAVIADKFKDVVVLLSRGADPTALDSDHRSGIT